MTNHLNHLPFEFSLTKNTNYLESVRLSFLIVFWYAPTTFLFSVGFVFLGVMVNVGMFILVLTLWLLTRILILVYGLAGRVHRIEDAETSV